MSHPRLVATLLILILVASSLFAGIAAAPFLHSSHQNSSQNSGFTVDAITVPHVATPAACFSATTCNAVITAQANSALVIIVSQQGTPVTPTTVAVHGYSPASKGSETVGGFGGIWVYLVDNVSAGSQTVYANYSTSHSYELDVVDAGNVTTSSFDAIGTGATGTTTGPSATDVTGVSNSLEIVGISANVVGSTNSFTVAAAGGDTLIDSSVSHTGSGGTELFLYGGGAYLAEAAAGSHALGITLSKSTQWVAIALDLIPATVPQAPTSLAHGTITSTTVPLTWTNVIGPVLNATVYQASYSGSCGSYTTQHNAPGLQVNSYSVTGLTAATAYCFKVEDWNTTGEGAASNVLTDVVTNGVLSSTFSASPTTTQIGETSVLSYTISGGAPPYTWTLQRNGSVSNLTGGSGSSYTTPSYTHAATYTYYFNATDSVAATSAKTATVVVDLALVATLSAAPSTTQVGEPSILSYGMSHGVTPYTWTLTRNGSGSNLSGASAGTYSASFLHAGTYTFYFNATDVVGSTSKVTATVTVDAALVATLSASPSTTQVGETSTFTYTITAGVGPITWTLTINGSGSNLSGASGGHYTFTPLHAATYTFYFNATDAVGSTSKVTTTVVVDAALVAMLSASPSTTQVGESSTLTYTITAGVTPITWTLTINGSGSNLSGASGGHYTFTPLHAATYTFYLNTTDAVGSTSKTTATVVVVSALTATLSASPSTTQVGESSTLTYTITAGVTPITWTLTINGSGSNLSGASGGHYTFTPLHAATYTFYFNATDAVGSTSKVSTSVVVEPALVVTLGASPSTTQVGEPSTLTYTITAGVTPITWTLTRNGSGSNLSGASAGTYSAAFLHAGTYTFYFNATDAVGSTSKATTTVVVMAALVVTLGASPSTTQVGEGSTLTYTITAGVTPISWTLKINGSGSNLSGASGGHYTFTPLHAATYTFYFNATDAVGSTSKVTATVTVEPALAVTLGSSPGTTQIGATSTLTYTISGGVVVITWTLTINGSGNLSGASGGHYTFTPLAAGTYTFYFNATDAVGSVSKATATVVVKAALVVTLSAAPSTTQIGEPAVITLTFAGGVGPVTWTFTVNGSVSNLSGVVGGAYTFIPAHAATYTLYLNATDVVGSVSKTTVVVIVMPALAVTLIASSISITLGGTVDINYTISGGVVVITWTLTINGTGNVSGAIGGTYAFTPGSAGNYEFYFNATDSVGSTSAATATVVVTSSGSTPLPPILSVAAISTIAFTASWSAPTLTIVVNYTLEYGTVYGTYTTMVSESIVLHATITGLPANTTFFVRVLSWTGISSQGPHSNVAVAHTFVLPQNFTATPATVIPWLEIIGLNVLFFLIAVGIVFGTRREKRYGGEQHPRAHPADRIGPARRRP